MDANQTTRMSDKDLFEIAFANIERNFQSEYKADKRWLDTRDLKPTSLLMKIAHAIAEADLDVVTRAYVDNLIVAQLERETKLDLNSIKAVIAAEGDQIFELATEILAARAKLRAQAATPVQQIPVMFMAVYTHAPDTSAYGFGNTAQEAAEVLVEALPSAAGKELDVLPVTPGCAMREIDENDLSLQRIVIPKTESSIKWRAPWLRQSR